MGYPIKVLALNDDNHSTVFITRGDYYSNAAVFMKECLLKPHDSAYIVKYVHLCDFGYSKPLPAWAADEKIDEMFDSLYMCSNPAQLFMKNELRWHEREQAFDFFWMFGEDDFYV